MLAVMTIVVLVLGSVAWIARDRQWAPLAGVLDGVDGWWARAVAYVSLAPATFVYLFVLIVTSWVLHTSDPVTSQHLLADHSTNLHNLSADPVGVLVTSAFWIESAKVTNWALLFGVVVAPIERWLGTLRTIGVFAAGHILSTLIVAVVLQHDLVALAGNDASRRSIDVGVSYGFFCLAAMFTYRLRGRWIWPWLWAAAITLDVIIPYALDRTFTGFGHLAAVAIGFALYPLSRRATARQRLAWPIWKPPAATVAAALASIEARRRARHPRLEALESGEPDDSVSGAGPAGP